MIQVRKKPFANIPQFSERDKAYTLSDESIMSFAKYEVSLAAFKQVIEDRKKFPVNRSLLVDVLKAQYESFGSMDLAQGEIIEKLGSENTFTVITAHQPSLFTGPLYFVYKIISAIHLSRLLKQTYPEYEFVPLFISGGEDHDFEEMNHLKMFNQEFIWESEAGGPVGKMDTDSLQTVLSKIVEVLGDQPNAKYLADQLSKHYASGRTYGKATLSFVNELFGEYGLLVLNMDHQGFKREFIPKIKQEIFDQISEPLINQTQEALEEKGFKPQAHAREINFFYMKKGLRERIVLEGDRYKVLNTDLSYTKAELEALIEASPECFSPNVVVRPLYQEFCLPNLAYIGGGGELAYWLERKSQFEAFNVFYPMLIRRNSALWVDKSMQKKLSKFDLNIDGLFIERDQIVKSYVQDHSSTELDFSEGLEIVEKQLAEFVSQAEQVDPTLGKSLEAEKVRLLKQVNQMTNRINRGEKQKHEVAIQQIDKLKDKLFPNNGLQERVDNFMPMYIKHGKAFFEVLLEHLNPLDKEFFIFTEE